MPRVCLALICAWLLTAARCADAQSAIDVTLAPGLGPTQSGRLIVFVKRRNAGSAPDTVVDFDAGSPEGQWIGAKEVTALTPRSAVSLTAPIVEFPGALSALPPGTYEIQAVLDRNHTYAYSGRGPGDVVSQVASVTLPGPLPRLMLDHEISRSEGNLHLANLVSWWQSTLASWQSRVRPLDFQSAVMSRSGYEPTSVHGWIALPPGYEAGRRFPTVYEFSGFGGTLQSIRESATRMSRMMASGSAPPMIWVYLDYAIATGTHEFTDSANNGPWGEALTTEVIPALERQYKMDARASGRFVTGHSTGGWTALWLQVRYPDLFGGAWPTSPDPSDFHDLFHVDLYRAGANFYHGPDGNPYALTRPTAQDPSVTLEVYTRSEAVLGAHGGQISTFEWIYSPAGQGGRPAPLFDRPTGDIDPSVAAYWCEHYDIARLIVRDWPQLKATLDGKIHLIVGTEDNYYLDGPAHDLEAAMRSVGAKTDFRYLPGKTHDDVYAEGSDPYGLLKRIASEMYQHARPDELRHP